MAWIGLEGPLFKMADDPGLNPSLQCNLCYTASEELQCTVTRRVHKTISGCGKEESPKIICFLNNHS